MNILGIWWFLHDGNITVSTNGKIDFAVQTERINRKKHSWIDSTKSLLEGLSWYSNQGNWIKDFDALVWSDAYLYNESDKRAEIRDHVKDSGKDVIVLDHHLAHLSSAYFSSPFREATLISLDGKWDNASWKIWHWKGNKIEELMSVPMEYSVGRVWNAANSFVGFPGYQYSGKTMALAGLWEPKYLKELLNLLVLNEDWTYFFSKIWKQDSAQNRAFFFEKKNIVDLFCSIIGLAPRKTEEKLRQQDYDLASSIQELTNIIAEHMVRSGVKITWSRNICIAWGVWLNGIMNKHILDMDCVDDVFIQPAASDMWLSLWCVQYHLHHNLWKEKGIWMFNPYLWRSVNENDLKRALGERVTTFNFHRSWNVSEEVAGILADWKIIWWVQWPEEFGPRALWNRSILASPIDPKMKDVINARVKHRESFRPFAPSVIQERSSEYFSGGVVSPYMLLIDNANERAKDQAPSIVHHDGTARVQTVTRALNQRFYDLIAAFWKQTGVPILLNTSLNDNEEPIVGNEKDALNFFSRNDIDRLVMWDYIISKK